MPQFYQAKIWSRVRCGKKDHNFGESEKYLHDKNKEDEEEPTGINETNEQAATGLDKYADHNIEKATIFTEV